MAKAPNRLLSGLAALLVMLTATAAVASIDPEAGVVDALVASAREPGPAWWRVSGPASSVYVLGVPSALPRAMSWDQSAAERRLKGANAIIVPPVVTTSPGDAAAILSILYRLHSQTPMQDGLSGPLKARFEADRPRVNADPRAYSHWMAAAAGLQMVADYRRKTGLDAAEPAKTLRRMAGALGVRVVPAASYKAAPLFKAMADQAAAVGSSCLADALDEIEAGPEAAREAATGWARGDVRAALSEPRGYEKCANRIPEGANFTRLAIRDTADAIAEALAKPGHSVAVVDLRALLAPGGVLQQLQARGFKVARPDAVGD